MSNPRAPRALLRRLGRAGSDRMRLRADTTVVLETCGSDFDTKLRWNGNMEDDGVPCGLQAVMTQTFSGGCHDIRIELYDTGGDYRLAAWRTGSTYDTACGLWSSINQWGVEGLTDAGSLPGGSSRPYYIFPVRHNTTVGACQSPQALARCR